MKEKAKPKKTIVERQKEFNERKRKLGYKGRKVWATESEHEEIKSFLESLRMGI